MAASTAAATPGPTARPHIPATGSSSPSTNQILGRGCRAQVRLPALCEEGRVPLSGSDGVADRGFSKLAMEISIENIEYSLKEVLQLF